MQVYHTVMDSIYNIILGAVQGVAEFLPISSTGHLIFVRELFGVNHEFGLAVDAMLHLATALAVLVYFRKDFIGLLKEVCSLVQKREVSRENRILLISITLGTIPAVITGLFLEDIMGTLFRNIDLVAYALITGSILMYVADRFAQQNTELSISSGWKIGLFQVLALVPGMSRAGSTIAGGLLLGLKREAAARFTFLLSFPIIFGAGAKKTLELSSAGVFVDSGVSIFAGAITAFIVGMFSIHYLLKFLKTHTLKVFIIYRLLLAVLILIFF